jgi:G protein beta subunit-like protein
MSSVAGSGSSVMPVVLVTGGYDHKIRFWDATSGMCTKSITFGDSGSNNSPSQVNCLAVSSDKSVLAAGGNPLIHLYDINGTVNGAADESPIITYDSHTSNVTAIGFQKYQTWIFSGSEDGTVRLWDPRANKCIRKYDCGSAVNAVALHPNQAELISGDQNGFVKVWDLASDRCREEFMPATDVPVRSISIAGDGSMVAVGLHKGKVFMYTPSTTQTLDSTNRGQVQDKCTLVLEKEFVAHEDYLLKCVISPDLKTLATTSADKSVKLWNITPASSGPSPDNGRDISTENSTVFSNLNDAEGTASSTSTSSSSVSFAPTQLQITLDKALTRHQRWVWDCVFSADSQYLLTASSDQSTKLWDRKQGEVIRNYIGHSLAVSCVALNDVSLE